MSDNMTTNYVRHLVQQGRWVELATHIERLQSRVGLLECQLNDMSWQPIETAPKDCKTQVLAWCKDYDHLFIVNYTGTEGMWYVSCSEGYIRPTHWMPLPRPPTK